MSPSERAAAAARDGSIIDESKGTEAVGRFGRGESAAAYPLTIYSAAAIQEVSEKLKVKDAEIETLKSRLEVLEKAILSITL